MRDRMRRGLVQCLKRELEARYAKSGYTVSITSMEGGGGKGKGQGEGKKEKTKRKKKKKTKTKKKKRTRLVLSVRTTSGGRRRNYGVQ